jgi:hypothetical protein
VPSNPARDTRTANIYECPGTLLEAENCTPTSTSALLDMVQEHWLLR